MKFRVFYLLLGIYFSCVKCLAQEKLYFNHTEVGFLYGRGMEDWEGNYPKRVDFTLHTFHGARITPRHMLGFSTGLDRYEDINLIPIALGYRGFFGKQGKPQLFAGLDLGAGSTLLEKKESNEWSRSWHEGGLLFSPIAGIKLPSKKDKTSLSFTLAYKRQDLSHFQGFLEQGNVPAINAASLPPGFNSLTETAYLFHSFVFRMGLMF
jgi:hypothetical protein